MHSLEQSLFGQWRTNKFFFEFHIVLAAPMCLVELNAFEPVFECESLFGAYFSTHRVFYFASTHSY